MHVLVTDRYPVQRVGIYASESGKPALWIYITWTGALSVYDYKQYILGVYRPSDAPIHTGKFKDCIATIEVPIKLEQRIGVFFWET